MRRLVCLIFACVGCLAGPIGQADAGLVTFYGIDLGAGPGGARPNAEAARSAFLTQLDPASIGVEDFEDNPLGSFHHGTHAISFSSTGVTATITSMASYSDEIRETLTSNTFATSGSRFYYSQDAVGGEPYFQLTFSTPQTAFGFFGISFSDYLGVSVPREPITLSLDGGAPIDTLNVSPNIIPGGSVHFFGLISDTPFTTVTLINTPFPSADEIGVDDIIIGVKAVPEPSSAILMGLGCAAIWGYGRRRRRA